jgi:uncharacterized repeat protein (TIGR01451 family)
LLALAAAVTVVLSVVGPVAAESPARVDLVNDKTGFEAAEATQVVDNQFKDAKEGIFLVRLEDAPVAAYRGDVNGFEATSPAVSGVEKLNTASGPARAYADYLEAEQAQLVNQMERTIGRTVDVRFSYQFAVNGLAVWLTPEEAAKVAKIPGVAAVNPDALRELQTDVGPAWIGAPGVWGGPDCSGDGTCGEGVVVGVLDTGINPSNPSFAEVGPVDGYVHTNPLGGFVGVCNPAEAVFDPAFPCNDKMIGAWNFTGDPGPVDDDGHGSHTASTAAGNIVDATVVGNDDPVTPITVDLQISGVAPHANVIAYDVCITTAGCPLSAIVAGIDQAVVDGVDVINYSIGGGASDPWNDDDSLGFLAARDAGIFVATSAGNSGPDPATVGSPADAPWITSVGASTHDRDYPNALVDMSGGDTAPPADIVGKGFTNGYGPAPIVYAGDFGDAGCLAPFPAGTWTDGEIVVCDRGAIARVEKGANVAAGGAGGYVLANDAANGDSLNGDAHFLPAVHIGYDDGVVLKAWIASGSGQTATITGAVRDVADANGDVMAAFSSRGPNPTNDIISPNVTGPGVDIIAADGTDDEVSWGFISGTSMSSPHVAGAGALLKGAHPDWSPAQMQSALMLTASTDVLEEDGATPADPFDQGSGSVRVDVAANSGLVLDVTTTEYLDADPGAGGDPTSINLASMAQSQCVGACGWTRTVTATGPGTWNVAASAEGGVVLTTSPTSFTLAAGESQSIDIVADASAATTGVWYFGEVTLTDGDEVLRMPVAVQATSGNLPDLVEVNTRRNAGSHPVLGLTAIEITDLTVEVDGMVIGTQVDESLLGDSDNSSPYDDPTDGAFTTLVAVPAGATHLIAETVFSESPDLDLFVGFDENNDGVPQESEEACRSTSSTALEFCDVANPEAGQWWILIQNWSASDSPPDDLTLSYAVLDGTDAGNFSVEGPSSAGALEPFDVRVFWDDATLESGDKAYAFFSLGSSPASPGNVGTVPVQLTRHEDDVAKTVSQATAEPGDTLTYEITVLPNVTNEDLAYEVTDTIPEGLTYVEGSVTGGATVTNGVLTWEGVQPTPFGAEGDYVATTSDNDESCDTGFGGYINLEDFGILAQSGVVGDTVTFSAFSAQNPLEFYGTLYTGASFSDDGFVFHGAENYDGSPWVPQAVPDVAAPNNVIAGLWQDFELVYDAATNAGVSLATAGPDVSVVEYDDLQLAGGSAPVADMNIVLFSRDDTPGFPEVVFAYDNLDLSVLDGAPATVGVENADGTNATAYLNAADPTTAISDGFMVCFDFQGPSVDPVVITYQVTVDDVGPSLGGGIVSNEVISIVDNPGSQPELTSAEVEIIPGGAPATVILGQVVDDLNAMIAMAEGSDYWALRQARYWADRAMEEKRWANESQPNIVGGAKVFIRTRTAVKKLQMIPDTSPWYVDAQALIDDLVASSRAVATSGLDAHIATAPVDAVEDAQYWLNRANKSASNGYPRYAIARYMKSWKKVTAYLR